MGDKKPLNLLRTPVGEMAEVEPLPSRWTWEERPVGEHDLSWLFRCRSCCRVCVTMANLLGPCPSRMERRRVTQWEPVPSEGERTQGDG